MTELSMRELALESGDLLPAREALAVLNVATVLASNSATALNVITNNSAALALAGQGIFVVQS